jgi:small subunit ribosomal protein S4e
MVQNHLKRIATPRTWNIPRKTNVFITRPKSGAHSKSLSTSLNTVIKEMLGLAATTKESKNIIHSQEVLVDAKRRHDERANVGFFDTVSFPALSAHYRIGFTTGGILTAFDIPAEEATLKLCAIVGKGIIVGGKTQLRASDGRTFIGLDSVAIGDSLLITLPSQEVKAHFPLKEGVAVMVYKGKYAGKQGMVEKAVGASVVITTPEGPFSTKRSYVFVTGDKKQALKCSP